MPCSKANLDRTRAVLNRVIQELRDEGDDGPGTGDYHHTYTFDPVGNRLSNAIDLDDNGDGKGVITH